MVDNDQACPICDSGLGCQIMPAGVVLPRKVQVSRSIMDSLATPARSDGILCKAHGLQWMCPRFISHHAMATVVFSRIGQVSADVEPLFC